MQSKVKVIMAQKNVLTASDYLPFEEYEKLIAGLRKDKQYIWELYATLSFSTALRTSDVRNLHWREVLRNAITVTEKKTKKIRTIKLNADVQAKIRRLYNLLGQPNANCLIFANKRTGEPITSQYVNLKLKEFKKKYNLEIGNFSTHTFITVNGKENVNPMSPTDMKIIIKNNKGNVNFVLPDKTVYPFFKDMTVEYE